MELKTPPNEQMRLSLLVCPIVCAFAALLLWMGGRRRTDSQSVQAD